MILGLNERLQQILHPAYDTEHGGHKLVYCTLYERAICCVPRHNISVIPLLHGVRTRLSRVPLTEIRLKESEGTFNDGLPMAERHQVMMHADNCFPTQFGQVGLQLLLLQTHKSRVVTRFQHQLKACSCPAWIQPRSPLSSLSWNSLQISRIFCTLWSGR